MAVGEFNALPSTLALYSRALLGSLSGKKGTELPALELVLRDVKIDRENLAAYNRVCGFSQRETLPVTYGFVLAFPLHMSLITDSSFPFAAMGLVHIQNLITQHRPVSASEILTIIAKPANLRSHEKGMQFDILTTLVSGNEVVWECVSTMLRRQAGGAESGKSTSPRKEKSVVSPTAIVQWNVPGDIGRRYGAIAGDRNPIHLYAFTAKLFGFPSAIAHGMWSKARCLAAMEGRIPDACKIDVQFKLPVLLPAKVTFHSEPQGDGSFTFGLNDQRSGKPHLSGSIQTI